MQIANRIGALRAQAAKAPARQRFAIQKQIQELEEANLDYQHLQRSYERISQQVWTCEPYKRSEAGKLHRLVFAETKRVCARYAHLATWDIPRELEEWAKRFRNKMMSRNIPLVVYEATGTGVSLCHGKHFFDLTRGEWVSIAELGLLLAEEMGIEVQWLGDLSEPSIPYRFITPA